MLMLATRPVDGDHRFGRYGMWALDSVAAL
jgi:hypothetical protein